MVKHVYGTLSMVVDNANNRNYVCAVENKKRDSWVTNVRILHKTNDNVP